MTQLKKNTKKIKTIEMELAIAKMFGFRQNIIVPNISWGFDWMHECDLFILRKSGVAIEVEIKTSKSDLLADFKKYHKHVDKKNRITEFYYAFPENMYDNCKDLIPETVGIILCFKYGNSDNTHARIERKAKRIKSARKLTIEEQLKIGRLGCVRIWGLKQKLINK